LLTSHRHEREISDITDLPHKEKVLVFAKMKKEGILQENRTRLKRPGDPLPLLHEKRQKNSSAVLKMCTENVYKMQRLLCVSSALEVLA